MSDGCTDAARSDERRRLAGAKEEATSDDLDKRIAKFNEELPQLVAPGANERFIAALITRDRRRGEEIGRLQKRGADLLQGAKDAAKTARDRGDIIAQDESRLRAAAAKANVTWAGCDTADHIAEALLYEQGLAERLRECVEAALDWRGPDGDHISDPVRQQLVDALSAGAAPTTAPPASRET